MSERKADVETFYGLMSRLSGRIGGPHPLPSFTSVVSPGEKGVYFIFEPGETRDGSDCLRVVRVGTHGLTARSRSTIWTRLFEHLMFNGRSVFRGHVKGALLKRDCKSKQDPKHGNSRRISEYIGNMLFLWVKVDGTNGHAMRKKIERKSIALLSNRKREPIDESSSCWLGRSATNHAVKKSGMWNVHYTKNEKYGSDFLSVLKTYIDNTNRSEISSLARLPVAESLPAETNRKTK